MLLGRKSSDQFEAAQLISRQAQRISNPLDRLRYLRAATIPIPEADDSKRWRYGIGLVLAAVALSSVATLRAWRTTGPRPVAQRPAALGSVIAAPSRTYANHISDRVADVWLVEQKGETEEYSNGLRVDTHWTVSNRPRSYPVFDVTRVDSGPAAWQSAPVGIVLHTSESDQAPFEPTQNGVLKHIAEGLLGYVQHKHAYNYVVDRFGRVHRVVRESDAANHSGYSVWADNRWLYLNLNDSFLGVSFEAQTNRGDQPAAITPAQVSAGALLIEMLRARYHLAAANCVTHAQVSVNPSNMRIGYHTDWAANFPFPEVGLPDNYARPLPGLYLCGFEYDRAYLASTGARLQNAIALSESRLGDGAAARQMPVSSYREFLQKEYRKKLLALRRGAPEGDAS
jgi:N-acetyl-anhydromuramyl-L-alanine amidase AmpD